MHRFAAWIAWAWMANLLPAFAEADEPAPSSPIVDEDFFEKHVRPVLAERCYKCHGADKQEAGLRVDNRASLLAGGDTGAAIVPGKTDQGYLLDAIRYGELYQMPPDGKLPAAQVAAIERWVAGGAIWPGSEDATVTASQDFDLKERAKHWAFQKVKPHAPPTVKNVAWPVDDIDRFILARLEAAGLEPSPPVERAVWLRRVSFAITGLPPTPAEIAAFEEDPTPQAADRTVSRLLDSPQFGERWARHWLDLARYAESRGHEFDYDAPNMWQYRDYLIRAFNADVPYDRLVQEHVAGDILPEPRRNPLRGYNESPLGTGFWYLGEWVHSPVDVRKDETERFDNMLDVFSKTFLGLTVACARCHDHKFDAISQADYYALAGFLQSTAYRQLRFETADRHQELVAQLDQLLAQQRADLLPAAIQAIEPGIDRAFDYLRAAHKATEQKIEREPSAEGQPPGPFTAAFQATIASIAKDYQIDAARLERWVAFLDSGEAIARSPWAAWSTRPTKANPTSPSIFATRPPDASLIVDFNDANSHLAWRQDGTFYELRAAGQIRPAATMEGPLASVVHHGCVARRPELPNPVLREGTERDPGRISNWNRPGRTFRTPNFTIEPSTIYYLVEGAGRTYATVDSHRVNQGPLHGSFIKEWETKSGPQWIAHDVRRYAGHRAHLEFTAVDDKPLVVYQVIQSVSPPAPANVSTHPFLGPGAVFASPEATAEFTRQLKSRANKTLKWLSGASPDAAGQDGETRAALFSFADWLLTHSDLLAEDVSLARLKSLRQSQAAQRQNLLAAFERASATAPAMWEGFPEDEEFLIRGNHLTPRDRVPRRYLEALGSKPASESQQSSGRLQLAAELVDPARNPAVARVIVNRVWHHLFGRGLVASTDNFGVLGSEPTHPELLDYLATEFVNDGWSIKRLIHRLTLTSVYSQQSSPGPGDVVDPQNQLWHRMQLKRLEGETIRDAMLAVSGRLDLKMFGPSVPVYLTPFMQGRGRPGQSGPLDGAGRRSVYIAVRRNFLSPMMLAFDQPIPFSSMGRRNVSNVPAQALILMNDPFVIDQAKVWASRLLKELSDANARIETMYLLAFARRPTEEERAAALTFLDQQGKELNLAPDDARNHPQTWADLCHVMFNVKEFVFVP